MKEELTGTNKFLEENAGLKDSLSEYRRVFDLFIEASASIDSAPDMDKTMVLFVNKISEIFKVNKVSFMLLDEARKELFIKAQRGLNPQAVQVRVKLGESFSGRVAQEGRPLVVRNVEEEFPELSKDRLSRYSSRSFVIMPLRTREGNIGVISLTDKKDKGAFSDDDLKLLNLICGYMSLHIESIQLSERLNNLAEIDPLTGLFSHRYFHEQLLDEIYRAERYKRFFSLLMLDIDDFAKYNQEYGYVSGDKILKQMARIIKENMRQTDVVSRYGPEEFAVILPETSLKEALFVGEKIRGKISEAVFTENRKSSLEMTRHTVSVGVTEHKMGSRPEELIQRLTSAVSQAKQKGKNRVVMGK